jgi:hypothetical protein
MQDWMENMSFTVKPANDRDNALDFKVRSSFFFVLLRSFFLNAEAGALTAQLRSDDMALDFAKAGTPTPGGRTSPNSLNDFDSSNFNATNSLASRTSTRIDDTKTVILWRGGLTFDGANMGDFTISFRGVPAHADEWYVNEQTQHASTHVSATRRHAHTDTFFRVVCVCVCLCVHRVQQEDRARVGRPGEPVGR